MSPAGRECVDNTQVLFLKGPFGSTYPATCNFLEFNVLCRVMTTRPISLDPESQSSGDRFMRARDIDDCSTARLSTRDRRGSDECNLHLPLLGISNIPPGRSHF